MQNKLPKFSDNPALQWFSHLLEKDGLYSAKDVQIYFNMKFVGIGKISGVTIIFYPRDYLRQQKYENHRVQHQISGVYNRDLFNCTSGNCCADWMRFGTEKDLIPDPDLDSNSRLGYCPKGDFDCFDAWGFKNEEERKKAIYEFARIRECQWARDLIKVEYEAEPL